MSWKFTRMLICNYTGSNDTKKKIKSLKKRNFWKGPFSPSVYFELC